MTEPEKIAETPPEKEFVYVAKVGAPLCSGWLRAEDRPNGNPMLTFRSTLPESQLPPGAPIVTLAEVDAW